MNVVLEEKHLEAKLSLPMDYERYFFKADEFLAKDSYAKAIRCFNRAIEEEPEETLGYECKASVLLSLKLYDAAQKLYEKVIALDEDADLAYYCLGLITANLGKYEEAIHHYETYMMRREKDAQALAELAFVRFLSGDIEGAKRDSKKAKKLEADNWAVKEIIERIEGK